MKKYKVARCTRDGKWYAVGFCGVEKGKVLYMPISDGYSTKKEAVDRISWQGKADAAAENCLNSL